MSVYTSGKQADATKDAQNSANAAQTSAEARARADLAPYNAAGQNALLSASDLSGANGLDAAKAARANFLQSPGYDWQFGQGLRAIDAGAASKGLLRSGATIKAEEAYGQGLASQDFNQYYTNLYNLANMGENAASKTGANAIQTGAGIAGTNVSTGSALSSVAGNLGSGISQSLTNGVNTYANNSLYQQRTNALMNGGSGPYSLAGGNMPVNNNPASGGSMPDSMPQVY